MAVQETTGERALLAPSVGVASDNYKCTQLISMHPIDWFLWKQTYYIYKFMLLTAHEMIVYFQCGNHYRSLQECTTLHYKGWSVLYGGHNIKKLLNSYIVWSDLPFTVQARSPGPALSASQCSSWFTVHVARLNINCIHSAQIKNVQQEDSASLSGELTECEIIQHKHSTVFEQVAVQRVVPCWHWAEKLFEADFVDQQERRRAKCLCC